VILLISSYRQRCAKCKAVLFLLTADFSDFRPAGATLWTGRSEIWHGESNLG